MPRQLTSMVAAFALAAAPAAAQAGAVVLRIHPRVGDTLYNRFEQQVEMAGTTRIGGVDTTLTMKTSMLLLSHIIVRGEDGAATLIETVTDSVALDGEGTPSVVPPDVLRRALQGRRVRLKVAADGSATVLDAPDDLAPDLQSALAGVPSTLPEQAIQVGGTWDRTMNIPVPGTADPRAGATLQITYRLDSLAAGDDVAYVSMKGTLTRDEENGAEAQGLKVSSSGNLVGSMRVDRRRGWWSDSRATITLRSTLTPSTTGRAKPVRVQTKITQWMRMMPK